MKQGDLEVLLILGAALVAAVVLSSDRSTAGGYQASDVASGEDFGS